MTDNQKAIVNASPSGIAMPFKGIKIAGLEEVPASLLPVPYVRLVQPTSTGTTLANGKDEAMPGTFLFNDTQEAVKEITFTMLKAKHGQATFERNGEPVTTPKLAILGMERGSNKLFILPLSVMSFSNFGKLVAKLQADGIQHCWEFAINVTSSKQENQKGKYYIAEFQIGEKLSAAEIKHMEDKYMDYGGVLEKNQADDVA